MNDIHELRRLDAPAQRPQSLAWDGSSLWLGSMAAQRIYKLDIESWTVDWETDAPGIPYGITVVGEELRVLCGETRDDNRYIRRCLPLHGFNTVFKIPCPDDTGSQLGYDGERLHVSQWYNQRVLALGEDGQVERVIEAPRGICGQVIVDGVIYLLTTADETTTDYYLTRIDARSDTPEVIDLARVPFPARALAFDGQHFWTNHREQHQVVRFEKLD